MITLLLMPAFIIFWPSTSADAAIYLTFIKNFATLPFSYQAHTVSFGATSPLHVLIQAPLPFIFGETWVWFAKVLNNFWLVLGIFMARKERREKTG